LQGIHEAEFLFTTHPLRLSLGLNFSVFTFEVMNKKGEAIRIAKEAFDNSLFDLQGVDDERLNETLRVMQLLRDNILLWDVDLKMDMKGKEQIDDKGMTEADRLAAKAIKSIEEKM
jgi:hypothetical protein